MFPRKFYKEHSFKNIEIEIKINSRTENSICPAVYFYFTLFIIDTAPAQYLHKTILLSILSHLYHLHHVDIAATQSVFYPMA